MASKDDIIAELRGIVAEQAKQIAAQAKRIDTLTNRIADLELKLAKAQKNSSNSSKSPSSDIVKPPPKKQSAARKGKKAKRGGQKGHKRKLREPLPPERVDQQITYEINDADMRELGLTPTDQFEIVQHIELLDMPIHVTYVDRHRHPRQAGAWLLSIPARIDLRQPRRRRTAHAADGVSGYRIVPRC